MSTRTVVRGLAGFVIALLTLVLVVSITDETSTMASTTKSLATYELCKGSLDSGKIEVLGQPGTKMATYSYTVLGSTPLDETLDYTLTITPTNPGRVGLHLGVYSDTVMFVSENVNGEVLTGTLPTMLTPAGEQTSYFGTPVELYRQDLTGTISVDLSLEYPTGSADERKGIWFVITMSDVYGNYGFTISPEICVTHYAPGEGPTATPTVTSTPTKTTVPSVTPTGTQTGTAVPTGTQTSTPSITSTADPANPTETPTITVTATQTATIPTPTPVRVFLPLILR
ncbi:MAG: hypothetical protein ACOCXQ_03525 [Patescibacteria group bacterium]